MQQPKILVAIRKRPLANKEKLKGETDIVTVKGQDTVLVCEYKQKVDLTKYLEESVFNFDFVFNQNVNNQQIYDSAVRPLVDSAFQGAKVTCFAYGQTGSGKTFTMNGSSSNNIKGLYILGAEQIFTYLNSGYFNNLKAKVSFFEIYCGKLFDLLNKRQELKIREDNKSNINIIGMEQTHITSCQQFIDILNYGSNQRITSQNSANLDSSRSHAILQIALKDGKKTFGKISFIDLAGNERGADHMDMNKQTRIDGAEINKSLLSLKQCIRALDQGKGHTPFRGSKLTMVLKDSFVGFCRTLMIGNVSPSSASSENTLNTLRYADRVKQLRKPQQGVSREDLKAKQMMLPRQNKNAIRIMINNDDDHEDIQKKREDAQKQFGIVQEEVPQRQLPPQINKIPALNKDIKVPPIKQPNSLKNKSQTETTKISMTNNNRMVIQQKNKNVQQPINPTKNVQKIPVAVSRNNSFYNNMPPSKDQCMEVEVPNLNRNLAYSTTLQKNNFKNQSNNQYDNYSKNKQIDDYSNPVNQIKNRNQNRGGQKQNNQMSENQLYQPHFNRPIQNYNNVQKNSYDEMQAQLQKYEYSKYWNSNNNVQGPGQGQGQQQQQQQQFNNSQYTNTLQFKNSQQTNPIQQFNEQQFNQQQHYSQQQYSQSSQQQYSQQQHQYNHQQQQHYNQRNNNAFKNNQSDISIGRESKQLTLNKGSSDIQNMGWLQMVSTVQNGSGQIDDVRDRMNEVLLQEQNSLISLHSNTLRKHIEIIKSEMSLLQNLQKQRDSISTREYVQFISESIEEKMSSLQFLRQSLVQYTYKLDDIEEIEMLNQESPCDDEQLLDDL